MIVVDDGSTDETGEVLNTFKQQYTSLKIIHINHNAEKIFPGKKNALVLGIAAAQHDRLLLTDADCKPSSDQWLQTMVTKKAAVVLGYGAYDVQPGLLNKFIRWETAHTCMQYAGYAAAGMPYMGVGRNLSYLKSLWSGLEKDEAFQSIFRNTPSGDDDLLICRIADKHNTAVCLDAEAHTISVPQSTWKAWWRQKTRHMSTGKYYPARVKNLLGLYGLSHGFYWLLSIALFFILPLNACLTWVLPLFLLRLCIYWINAMLWYRKLDEKKLSLFYPLGDLGWALYNVFLSPYILWKNKQAWK